jgi:hypothetical protein
MQPPCPHCDQPDLSLLRLVLIGEILRADATWLVLVADLLQQLGLLDLTDEPTVPPVRPQQGALHTLRRSPPVSAEEGNTFHAQRPHAHGATDRGHGVSDLHRP